MPTLYIHILVNILKKKHVVVGKVLGGVSLVKAMKRYRDALAEFKAKFESSSGSPKAPSNGSESTPCEAPPKKKKKVEERGNGQASLQKETIEAVRKETFKDTATG